MEWKSPTFGDRSRIPANKEKYREFQISGAGIVGASHISHAFRGNNWCSDLATNREFSGHIREY